MSNVTSTVSTNATYLTKYFAGGSGDNIIPDGYIKTVEKIWMDTYTLAFTNTLTAIAIAEIPENKKIISWNGQHRLYAGCRRRTQHFGR